MLTLQIGLPGSVKYWKTSGNISLHSDATEYFTKITFQVKDSLFEVLHIFITFYNFANFRNETFSHLSTFTLIKRKNFSDISLMQKCKIGHILCENVN